MEMQNTISSMLARLGIELDGGGTFCEVVEMNSTVLRNYIRKRTSILCRFILHVNFYVYRDGDYVLHFGAEKQTRSLGPVSSRPPASTESPRVPVQMHFRDCCGLHMDSVSKGEATPRHCNP